MSLLQPTLGLIMPAGAGVLLAGAALHDVALRTIPNTVSIGLGLIGLALRLQDGWILTSLSAATAVFTLALLCWRRGWLGGGDVKLIAATTLIVPPLQVGSLLVLVAQCGGVLALIYLALSRVVRVAPAGQPGAGPGFGGRAALTAHGCRGPHRAPAPPDLATGPGLQLPGDGRA